VAVGISDPAAKALLINLDFNIHAPLKTVLFSGFDVDPPAGKTIIQGFVPNKDVAFQAGATHLSLQSAFAKVNFEDGSGKMEMSNIVNLPIDSSATNVALTPSNVPSGNGTSFYLLKLTFYELVNTVQYPLLKGAANACSIIQVL